jgi:hypothetical protein
MSSPTNQIPIIRQAIEPPNVFYFFIIFLGKDPPGNGEEHYTVASLRWDIPNKNQQKKKKKKYPTTLIAEWAVAWTDGRDGNIDIY